MEQIIPFQATFIGSPYPAQLITKIISPTWNPKVKPKKYKEYQETLPSFIQAIDSYLRETLTIIDIPGKFERSQLYALIMSKLSDYVESDIQLKSFIQTFEKSTARNDPSTYIKTLKRYFTEIDSIAASQISGLAYTGLTSDIPFDVFCSLALSYDTYRKLFAYVISVAEARLSKLFTKGFRPRTIKNKATVYLNEIKPVMTKYAEAIQKQFRLLLYVDLANSASYEEILKPKILNVASMNPATFDNYYLDFQKKLQELRHELYNKAPNLFEEKIDPNDPSSFLWAVSARRVIGGSTNEG